MFGSWYMALCWENGVTYIIMFWFRQEVCGSLSGGLKKKAAYPECCSAECPGYLLCRLLSTRTAVYICRRTAVYNTTSKHQTQHNKRIFSNSSALLNVSPPIISYSRTTKTWLYLSLRDGSPNDHIAALYSYRYTFVVLLTPYELCCPVDCRTALKLESVHSTALKRDIYMLYI